MWRWRLTQNTRDRRTRSEIIQCPKPAASHLLITPSRSQKTLFSPRPSCATALGTLSTIGQSFNTIDVTKDVRGRKSTS